LAILGGFLGIAALFRLLPSLDGKDSLSHPIEDHGFAGPRHRGADIVRWRYVVNAKIVRLQKMAAAMKALWDERAGGNAPRFDLISMLAHSDATRNIDFRELLATCSLLIVGGNDTTRNSMSAGVWGFSQFPEQYQKLRRNPELVQSLVSEIISWHTPVLHLRRTALADFELGGKTIRKGDKVAMWFVSGNRDDEAIKDPQNLIVDRPRAREHISFGFGVHRCAGDRLAIARQSGLERARLIAIAALLQQFDKRHSLVGQCRNVKVAGTISFRTISRPEI
jgi:cytochrome P450